MRQNVDKLKKVIYLNHHQKHTVFVYHVVCLMVFNATFNNISVISWQSVLLVEETRGPGENHRPVVRH